MAGGTPVRREVFVQRARQVRPNDWGWLFVFCAALAAVNSTLVIIGGTIRFGVVDMLVNRWSAIVWVASAAVALGAAIAASWLVPRLLSRRRSDREGISLIVDEAGVYLVRLRPRRYDWAEITGVTLVTRLRFRDRRVLRWRSAHSVEFRFARGKARRWLDDDRDVTQLRTVVEQFAPSVPVTSRLLAPEPRRRRARPSPPPPESPRMVPPPIPVRSVPVRPAPPPPTSITPRKRPALPPRRQMPPARRPRRSGRR
ncbi:MAG TPA: hypothetical protein VFV67_08595 [Actinophytocola sp.]|uniref:hypothetical protein n=1 Tax=Actinophytocola sp. TaxID=1872138 RepID=UPI002DBA0CA8|nr:hypothetical protein [Actinophytocola sp.]HEU5470699.1 hypothetical protein [Actinophytocola sp.]